MSMRIVSVETVRPKSQANICYVRIATSEGLTGLGEAFVGGRAVEAYIHESVAPLLLGSVDPSPELAATMLKPYTGYQGGVEVRGNGAVDIALWDLLSKEAGLPLARMLGGPVRTHARIYNTCAGPGYVSGTTRQVSGNWGLREGAEGEEYEDLAGFLERPGALARSLWNDGYRALKVWPFDLAAEASGGWEASKAALRPGVDILEAIRGEVGDGMDIMVELHGLWSRRGAEQIAGAISHINPYWMEDPLRSDAVVGLAALRESIDIPIAGGETSGSRRGVLPLLERSCVDVLTLDVGWTGGLSEARQSAGLADMFGVPIAPHDCNGPVSLAVGLSLLLSQPNGLIQETSRAFLRTWYGEVTQGVPRIEEDQIYLGDEPGHGVVLSPHIEKSALVDYRASSL